MSVSIGRQNLLLSAVHTRHVFLEDSITEGLEDALNPSTACQRPCDRDVTTRSVRKVLAAETERLNRSVGQCPRNRR